MRLTAAGRTPAGFFIGSDLPFTLTLDIDVGVAPKKGLAPEKFDREDPKAQANLIEALIKEHGMAESHFRQLRDSSVRSIGAHMTYLQQRVKTDSRLRTFGPMGQRLFVARQELAAGAPWPTAIARAVAKHPVR